MTTFKRKCQVILLPTDEKAVFEGQLVIGAGDFLFTSRESDYIGSLIAQHLYILSDNLIKEGDWVYNEEHSFIGQVIESNKLIIEPSESIYSFGFKTGETKERRYRVHQLQCDGFKNQSLVNKSKKIITTTDKSLNLSQLSPQFIQKYIEEYNKGNIITEVMVEYEEYPVNSYGMSDGEPDIDIRLKVDKDNCITITKVKDSWAREEVESLLFQYAEYNALLSSKGEIEDFNKWVVENL